MQWLQSAFSSNSSNSSTKSDSPISKTGTNFKDINYFFRKSKPSRRVTRRLTRQRKLRHLTDIDVGHLPLNNFVRFAENLESPSDLNICSSPAVPQPLPLPDSFLFCRDSPSTSSHSAHPLPSPHEVRSRAQSEDNRTTESIDGDEIEDGLTFNGIGIGIGRSSTYHTNHKSADNVDTLSEKSPIGRGKKVLKDQNGFGNVQNNFRLIASAAASAPASGIPSPTHSPRRNSTGEAFPSPYLTAQGFIWSAPEFAAMDIMDLSSQAPSDKTWSPHHAPGLTYKSASATTSPLHPRSPASTSRHESNGQANVHRLPLPPGPAVSSQTVATHQTITKPDVPMMTSQWQKGKLIGRGTFGSVYVATNRETGALCAMKEVDLIPDDSKSAECMKQLEQEIKVLSQLKHPNIVQYYGSEIVGDHFYIYLEYVHPGSINKYVRDHYGAITESVVRNFTRHILYGLAYLHSTKTVHRDIKGANLLVDASGVVKLADFGMAKHFSGQASELSMKGSPYWMAPEIIHAVNKKDANGDFAFAVDIWSLGCTIIEIVNGKPPWSEYEGAAAMFKVWKETPPIPKSLSPLGKDFLQCCFRRNPAERPSASKLLEHPFVKNSIQTDIQACTQSFAAMKLGDASRSPRKWTTYKVDSMLVSSRIYTNKGKLSCNGEIGQQSHPKTTNTPAACLLSPRSTLEAHPSLSPPHSDHPQTSKPSSNGINGTQVGRGGSNHCTRPKTNTKLSTG